MRKRRGLWIVSVIVLSLFLFQTVGCSATQGETRHATSVVSSTETNAEEETTPEAADTVIQTQSLPEDATSEEKIDAYMSGVNFSGTILVQKDGVVVFEKAYGYSNEADQTPNETDSVYEIGSVTKQFTAACIMMLVEDGKLSVSDTLDQYVPEYTYASQITILQLLNMTSGIYDYVTDGLVVSLPDSLAVLADEDAMDAFYSAITRKYTQEEMIDYFNASTLQFLPGTQYDYSSTNYYLLGMVIERISGMSYVDFVTENIFVPLGMSQTSFDPSNQDTTGYFYILGEKMEIPSQDPSISWSVGGIIASVSDLLIWEDAVMEGKLLSQVSWDEIFDGGAFGYGYGWEIGDGYYAHSGVTIGYRSRVLISLEDNLVIIVLSNTNGPDLSYSGIISNADEVCDAVFDLFEN